jgi:hypothetical protein
MQMLSLNKFGISLLVYALLFLLLTFPFWGLHQTISPHRKSVELGVIDNTGSSLIENRKFSDFTNVYIPEIHEHLQGGRSGVLKLWAPQNELGRPVYHMAGFSPAYPPSWVIAKITRDPLRFITVLSLSYCFLSGLFVILFCREKAVSPLAGLIAGGSFAACPFFMYWLTFPMFLAAFCWTAGALWGCTRIAAKRDLVGWTVLAFSIYSLLLTAYPQAAIFHGYILAGYGLYLSCLLLWRSGWSELGPFLALSASAVIVGGVLAVPVHIDLAHLAAESARVSLDPSFFTGSLPKLDTFAEAVRFIVLSSSPELFGNPVETDYPFPYDGISATPLIIFFAVIALLASFRQTWGWWLSLALICLITFVHPVYLMGVKYLGFNLSRSNPVGLAILPLMIIVAYGVDALVKRSAPEELLRTVWFAAATVLMIIVAGVGVGLTQAVPIRWGIAIILVMIVLLLVQATRTHLSLTILALLLVGATVSFPLMLRQYPAQIAMTSPLVEKVWTNLPVGSRFAVAAPEISVLPPNLNAELGIASVHSHNSLSSRRYHTLITALGGEMHAYGGRNAAISPDYNSAMFWMSNISVMLSPQKLSHANLEYLGEESGIHLYKVLWRMGESVQIPGSPISMSTDGLQLDDPRLLQRYTPLKLMDKDDMLEFQLTSGISSVLVLSQKFHSDWHAKVFDGLTWADARTIEVNGVFQGVLLPREAQRVRLEFKPYVRFAWIAPVFWLLLLGFAGFRLLRAGITRLMTPSFNWP